MEHKDRLRLRVQYVKEGRLAFLGHLEVLRTIDRSVRRSGLPFSVGNGFARRMRIQFSQALPVGSSSGAEYYDVQLCKAVDPEEAAGLLRDATPPDLAPVRAAYVDPTIPALEAWLNRQSWIASLEQSPNLAELDRAIRELREEAVLPFMRGDKPRTIDLNETLLSYRLEPCGDEATVYLETLSSNRGALRPQILLSAALERLGAEDSYIRVRRVAQMHDGGAALVEPFDPIRQITLT